MRAFFDWGLDGAEALRERAACFVVVDVLSFSTAVDVACGRGAEVIPVALDRAAAAVEAARLGAVLAGKRREGGYSLSPASLADIPAGTKIVLPSPNGATISAALAGRAVFAGCLRNAGAVARAAAALGGDVAVIAAGERWRPSGALRPALEDLLGAGAILAALDGAALTPEAEAARAAFAALRDRLGPALRGSASGRELSEAGFTGDLDWAAALDVSSVAPRLFAGGFRG